MSRSTVAHDDILQKLKRLHEQPVPTTAMWVERFQAVCVLLQENLPHTRTTLQAPRVEQPIEIQLEPRVGDGRHLMLQASIYGDRIDLILYITADRSMGLEPIHTIRSITLDGLFQAFGEVCDILAFRRTILQHRRQAEEVMPKADSPT